MKRSTWSFALQPGNSLQLIDGGAIGLRGVSSISGKYVAPEQAEVRQRQGPPGAQHGQRFSPDSGGLLGQSAQNTDFNRTPLKIGSLWTGEVGQEQVRVCLRPRHAALISDEREKLRLRQALAEGLALISQGERIGNGATTTQRARDHGSF
ncbi:hypothetical protein AB4Z40_29900 [Bosea sp. 2YAB26]|uniref:hypothetical protein n=1 Tax=Bosea sp. 2YAB26 TaxID=3237478 RepID=UPI003F8E7CB6